MSNLSLVDVIKKVVTLETEIETLKKHKFCKLFNLNIKAKERELKKLKKQREELSTSKSLFNHLKQEKIYIFLGQNFIQNSDKLYNITIMRESMAKNWGYILPNIRISEATDLLEDEFEIFITGGNRHYICKLPENYPSEKVMDFLIKSLQTYLFDNVSSILDVFSMCDYIEMAIKNLETEFSFDSWVTWGLKEVICSLLKERYCVLNINFILNTFLDIRYGQGKNNFDVINELKNNLPKYPEELFVSDWTINCSQVV